MATETLKFKLELYATYWNKPPIAEIKIADKTYFKDKITGTKQNPIKIEFEHTLENETSHTLNIIRTGKTEQETVLENDTIIKDQLLNIKYMEIDEIDLGALTYDGVYTPEYPERWATQQRDKGVNLPKSFKNVTQMGHNGIWTFNFTSPFYMWLLENLY